MWNFFQKSEKKSLKAFVKNFKLSRLEIKYHDFTVAIPKVSLSLIPELTLFLHLKKIYLSLTFLSFLEDSSILALVSLSDSLVSLLVSVLASSVTLVSEELPNSHVCSSVWSWCWSSQRSWVSMAWSSLFTCTLNKCKKCENSCRLRLRHHIALFSPLPVIIFSKKSSLVFGSTTLSSNLLKKWLNFRSKWI